MSRIISVEGWLNTIEKLDATNVSPEIAIAFHILSNLGGYRINAKTRPEDACTVANALQAYAKLLHQHGVSP